MMSIASTLCMRSYNKKERIQIYLSIVAYVLVWCVSFGLLFGPTLYSDAETASWVSQKAVGMILAIISVALLYWLFTCTETHHRKRMGTPERIGYYDLLEMRSQIDALNVKMEELARQLDQAYEQIADNETLIRALIEDK